jgi:hypothetical protein
MRQLSDSPLEFRAFTVPVSDSGVRVSSASHRLCQSSVTEAEQPRRSLGSQCGLRSSSAAVRRHRADTSQVQTAPAANRSIPVSAGDLASCFPHLRAFQKHCLTCARTIAAANPCPSAASEGSPALHSLVHYLVRLTRPLLSTVRLYMAKVKVYRVKKYEIKMDEYVLSRRWATREGAQRMGGEILERTEMEIDDSQLQGEPWTPLGFTPSDQS